MLALVARSSCSDGARWLKTHITVAFGEVDTTRLSVITNPLQLLDTTIAGKCSRKPELSAPTHMMHVAQTQKTMLLMAHQQPKCLRPFTSTEVGPRANEMEGGVVHVDEVKGCRVEKRTEQAGGAGPTTPLRPWLDRNHRRNPPVMMAASSRSSLL